MDLRLLLKDAQLPRRVGADRSPGFGNSNIDDNDNDEGGSGGNEDMTSSLEGDSSMLRRSSLLATPSSQQEEDDDDDEGVFEIEDYSLVTEWERFIGAVEEQLRVWMTLSLASITRERQEDADGARTLTHSVFKHNGRQYNLVYVVCAADDDPAQAEGEAMSHMSDTHRDFPSPAHHISRWFGVRRFVVLDTTSSAAITSSDAALLLSTLSVAITNTNWPHPGFTPMGEKWRCEYQGICIRHGITCRFQTASLFSAPYYHSNSRTSLLNLLFEKMGINASSNPVSCSIASRFTFMRGGFDERAREQRLQNQQPLGTGHEYRNSDYLLGVNMIDDHQPEIEFEHAHRTTSDVLWGTVEDPIDTIHLAVQWLQEGTSAELSKFTLHPLHPLHTILVPQWAVRAIFHARPECLMTESFRLLISAFSEAEAFSSFESVFEMSKDLALPLMNAVSAGLATLRSSRLPSSAHIDAVIKSLFSYEGANAAPVRELPASCKIPEIPAAPANSLLVKFAMYLLNLEGLKALSLLWSEFVKEVRWHWENSILMPNVSFDFIDLNHCLIHQKLQMLNYCISKRLFEQQLAEQLARPKSSTLAYHEDDDDDDDAGSTTTSTTEKQHDRSNLAASDGVAADSAPDDDDAEGWDAFDDELEIPGDSATPSSSELPSKQRKQHVPEGREGALYELEGKVLAMSGEPMFVPKTQDLGLMTSDMIREQQHLLACVGTSEEAALVRAKMQTASLLSDMQAFKAANPGSVLADFVRWYSPRDWIAPDQHQQDGSSADDATPSQSADGQQEEQEPEHETYPFVKGRLSARMRQEGNLWSTTWNQAEPLPISKQPSLVKFEKEGAKVIEYLATLTPSDTLEQMMGVAVVGMFAGLYRDSPVQLVDGAKRELAQCATAIEQSWGTGISIEECGLLAEAVHRAELAATQAHSLLGKFDGQYRLVSELLASVGANSDSSAESAFSASSLAGGSVMSKHIKIESIEERDAVHALFKDPNATAGTFGFVDAEEYVVRAVARRPFPTSSRPTLSRLYAMLTSTEFRLATVLASDDGW